MKKLKPYLLLIIFFALTLAGCKKIDVPNDTPTCIKKKIRKLLKEDCPSVKTVYQYSFQGQTVYSFSPQNCGADLTGEVVDDNCNTICWLGGISGNILCNGDTFYKATTNEKLIWQDN
ncbi:MAG: hypothetical protein FVQ77_02220 [Cytophagales bacterium]|nr:hypothetical protein [Cytophagales bacterium]